jgi:hypothetical protein
MPTKPAKNLQVLMDRVVLEYGQAVQTHGVGSRPAKAIREKYADDAEFLEYADTLDTLHSRLRSKSAAQSPGVKPSEQQQGEIALA